MARATTKKPAKSTTKPATQKPAAKIVAPARRSAATKTSKVVKSRAPAKQPAVVKTPALSKEELRTQLDKAEKTIATLRSKSRAANRELKAAAARIEELEAQVAKLDKKLAAQPKVTTPAATAKKPGALQKPRKPRDVTPAPAELPDTSAGAPVSAPAETETSFED